MEEIQDGRCLAASVIMWEEAGHCYTELLCEWRINVYYVRSLKFKSLFVRVARMIDPDYIFDNPGYSLINVKQVFWSFLKCFYQEKVENLGFVKWTFAYPVKMQANKLENGVWFWDIEVYTCISMYITKTCIQKNCRKLTRKRLLSFF